MIRRCFDQTILAVILMFATVAPIRATLLLDDMFADGTRTNQSLPTDAAWFASKGGSLTAVPGAMTMAMGTSAILGVSYFTSDAASPASLGVGDTLVTTITFTLNGVAPLNPSQGFRLAICNFGDNRAGADFSSSSSQGANVQGYALFQTMGETFNNATPMDIQEAHDIDGRLAAGNGQRLDFPGNRAGKHERVFGF